MISREDCYAAWAPEESAWSAWAKPVVFATAPALVADKSIEPAALELPGLPRTFDAAAIVVDLPGAEAVAVGLALADRGYRPVPLFNGTFGPNAVVPVEPIAGALAAGVTVLARFSIAPDARPAFLLDANRMTPIGANAAGRYDNRWVVLPQDLPSGTRLRSTGIQDIVVIRPRTSVPDDLSHVLLRWKEAGLRLRVIATETRTVDESPSLTLPSHFRRLWYGAVALMGLRRASVGGFGSLIPEQTRQSGFYG